MLTLEQFLVEWAMLWARLWKKSSCVVVLRGSDTDSRLQDSAFRADAVGH